MITMILLLFLGAMFMRGFREVIGLAVIIVGVYLVLNGIILQVRPRRRLSLVTSRLRLSIQGPGLRRQGPRRRRALSQPARARGGALD